MAEGQQAPTQPIQDRNGWVSSQQLQRFDIAEIHILSTEVRASETARDLEVVIDSQCHDVSAATLRVLELYRLTLIR